MQSLEIEIVAAEVHEAIEASIDQTAEKYNVPFIQVKRYSAQEITNHFDIPGRAWRVGLDFETDESLFDYSLTEEGFISYFE